ncbi:MAG: ATPase, T2SS/T4P/T4SS family, partial [Patescibacteria group bacterium]|nr:ATPase, T2SS/T4P/T4SS family [Patescibacteria group bacterium]
LLIVAGPNDSGKTSTAAAFIEDINKREKRYIITLEDPIEYLFINKKSIIEQRQIGRDVKSYVAGLKHCLDEDVDLVFIDEIKKEFVAALPFILQLAAGNSLVVLEMNAANSIRVIEKILDAAKTTISPEAARFSLADVLVGIVTQKLIPRLGGGLVLASEILIVNSAVKSLIREGKIYQIESIIQTSREEGMISIEKAVEELVKRGEVSPEEARKIKLNI